MKLRDTPPTYCSACFNQNVELQHVDFEAYWDGPVLDMEGSIKVPIDDLVLCETCLSAGAMIIGMIHNKQMRTENFELGRALEEKDHYIAVLEKAISDLEHTLGLSLAGKIRRGTGRPTISIPENLEEIVRESLRERQAA